MCCSADGPGDELERSLAKLVDLLKDGRFDHVVIETSGLANPGPLISMLFSSQMARSKYLLDGVIAVVDCKHIMWHLGAEMAPGLGGRAAKWVLSGAPRTLEAQHQLLAADVIILNKTDLVSAAELQAVRVALTDLNSCAAVQECQHSRVNTEAMLQLQAFDLAAVSLNQLSQGLGPYSALASLKDEHSSDTGSTTLTLPPAAVLQQAPLMQWLQTLLKAHWRQLYRVKGILPVRCDGSGVRDFVVQGVHAELYGEFASDQDEAADETMPQSACALDAAADGEVCAEWLGREECSHHAAQPQAQAPGDSDHGQDHPVLVLIGRSIELKQRVQWQRELLACCEA